jgi:hypothetical protein
MADIFERFGTILSGLFNQDFFAAWMLNSNEK